jgi:hypothetical protein
MIAIEALARSAADYLLVAFALALVTATLLVAIEELGARQVIHRTGVRLWLTARFRRVKELLKVETSTPNQGVTESEPLPLVQHLPISESSYALPYKQLVAVIASLVQADLRTGRPYPFAGTLAQVGQATMAEPQGLAQFRDFFASPDSTEADLNFFAERALDDLQAFLALYTARIRYLLSILAVCIQVFVLWLQRTHVVDATLGSLFLYPTSIVAAVLFAPVLRNVIDRLNK